jgi:hypothetical protein
MYDVTRAVVNCATTMFVLFLARVWWIKQCKHTLTFVEDCSGSIGWSLVGSTRRPGPHGNENVRFMMRHRSSCRGHIEIGTPNFESRWIRFQTVSPKVRGQVAATASTLAAQ